MAKGVDVLVMLATQYAFDREAFVGAARCADEHGDIFISPKFGPRTLTQEVAALRPDGLLISTTDAALVREAAGLALPCVNVANDLAGHARVPVVGTDDAAIGRMVAEHYLDRGFRSFAYFADPAQAYFHGRRDGFVAALAAAGFGCAVGPPVRAAPAAGARRRRGGRRRRRDRGSGGLGGWGADWAQAGRWLASLPKPLGVMCPFDRYAREAVQACKTAGLAVPEQVSVIGVDNDPLLCLSVWPQTSSVVTPAAQIGYRAMDLLHGMIADDRRPPKRPVLLPPAEIVVRASSSEMAIADADVAAAAQYIRSHLREPLKVSDVTRHVMVSRRTLERKFADALHRTPLQEIRRARVAHAKRLLIETDLALPEVARRSGLIRHQRLSNLIKADCGLTPVQFRSHFTRRG